MRLIFGRPSRDYISLTFLWVIVQALPWYWLADGRHFHWEIVQVKKLMEYGFWARKGAILSYGTDFGILPNPADFNYVNHPYPILWLYALLYWLFGKVGPYALVGLGSLAGCLLTYGFLKRLFPLKAAWITAALLVAAHATVEFTTNPDIVAQGAIVWPLAGLAIIALKDPGSRLSHAAPWLVGLVVFLAGQISWFALTTMPALLLLCLPDGKSLAAAIRRPWSVPGWVPILVGGTLSFLVFIGQVMAYSPSLQSSGQYLNVQMGVGRSFISSRVGALPVLLLRMLLAGPALWLGAIVCLTQLRKSQPVSRLVWIMGVYLGVFVLVMLTIPRFLLLNQHAFRYALFPCAVMTAFAFTSMDRARLRGVLLAIALPSLLFCYAKLHEYHASTASMALGHWLGDNTGPKEVLPSNLTYLTPPIQTWDGEFVNNTSAAADRLIFPRVADSNELFRVVQPFKGRLQQVSFLRECSQPIDPTFLSKLESEAREVVATNLAVPKEGLVIFKAARTSLWNLLGTHAPQYDTKAVRAALETNAFSLKLYRLSPAFIRELSGDPSSGGR